MEEQKKWTEEELNKVKTYLDEGLSYSQIAQKVNRTYDSVREAVRRYRFNAETEETFFNTNKSSKKLSYGQIIDLSKYLGEKIYENYKVIKLDEPKSQKSNNKKEETSILDISDVHLGMINEVFDSETGKKITTYNMDIFQKELQILQNGIFSIHSLLNHSYTLNKLVIFVLGDIITNDRIFKEQAFEIEKVVGLQIWDGVNYFTKLFNNLLNLYQEIEVVCCVGNHGRSMPDFYSECVENNFEYFMYKVWEKQFEGSKRIKIIVPSTRRYIHKIYNWRHLIEHGDSLIGSSENAVEKQIKDLSLNVGGFDVMHFGHFHKLKEREIADKVIVKQSGCWILKDDYSFKKYKTYSIPKQWFFGCSEKRIETWNFKLDIRI